VVVGVQNLVQDLTTLPAKYKGILQAFPFPNFEAGAKINTDKLKIKLSSITVGLLGITETLTGSVVANTNPSPHEQRFLSVTGKDGIFIGVRAGDIVKVKESVVAVGSNSVDPLNLRRVTTGSPSLFLPIQPGDIATITDVATGRVVTANVILVASGYFEVDADLPAGTNTITIDVIRQLDALVKSVPTDQKLELDKELSVTGVSVNTFVVHRKLISGSTNVIDQPLSTGVIALTNSSYSLATISTTNDAFTLSSNIAISGFTGFDAYPYMVVTNPYIVSSGTTITNDTGGTVDFSKLVKVGSKISIGSGIYTVTSVISTAMTLNAAPGPGGFQFSSITFPEFDKKVVEADVSTSYVALRTANANKFMEVPTDDLIESIAGPYHVDNPIGVAVTAMAANTAKSVYFIPVQADNEQGYLAALAALESKFVYNVCALSQAVVIQSFTKSHVDAMSTPVKGRWRVAWANLAEPTEGLTPKTKGGSLQVDVTAGTTPTGTVYLYDPKANFANASIGDYIKVYEQDNVSSTLPSTGSLSFTTADSVVHYYRIYKIIEKINSSKLKLEIIPYVGENAIYTNVANSSVVSESTTFITEYEIIKVLTRSEQAQTIAATAASFSDRRVLLISNGSCVMSINNTAVEVPGYYLAAALAGLSAETLPHQPLTNYPIAGFIGVRGGSEKYDDNQQGIIAAGGAWLVVQDVLDTSIPYTWQQLSTSQGGIKEQEFSFTKNLDEISYGLSLDHARFPGRNNIVPETLAAIESQAIATLESRKNIRYNSPLGGYLGPQILEYSIGGVIEDPLILDLAYSDITVKLPLPLNAIDFRLIA
jgi:hypothetical protein